MSRKSRIRSITFIALGAVILSVCSWISIPTPLVPFTLQTFGVYFLLHFFGARRTFFSLLVYIALGLVGVPVFSSFGSGVGTLFGATGGFVFGFLVSVALCIAAESIFCKNRLVRIAISGVSLAACYAVGCLWATRFVSVSFLQALGACLVSFGAFDILKIVLAVYLSDYLKRVTKISA